MRKIFLIGNLTADPEVRNTPHGVPVCTFNLAVNPRFTAQGSEPQPQFFRVTAWRGLGENCSLFLSKGKKACVVGELTARTYEAKDGTTRVSLEVTADEVEFLSPREAAPQQPQGGQGYQRQQGQGQTGNGWQDVSDDDFPFA